MRFGKKGVERSLEDELRGRAGAVQVEVNAVGRVVRELDRTEGQPGSNALLTIDLDLQRFAAEKLKEHQSGSVVVLDVVTGDVLAMVLDARLRSQHLRPRHHPERMARPARQPRAAAQQQGDQRRLSAGLDLQDGDGAGGAGIQGDRSLDAAALPRLHRARQHQVPLLAAGRPRLDQRRRGDHRLLRLLLLRGRAPGRRRPHRRRGRPAGLRQAERARPAGRVGRASSRAAPGSRRSSASPGSMATRSTSASARAT